MKCSYSLKANSFLWRSVADKNTNNNISVEYFEFEYFEVEYFEFEVENI